MINLTKEQAEQLVDILNDHVISITDWQEMRDAALTDLEAECSDDLVDKLNECTSYFELKNEWPELLPYVRDHHYAQACELCDTLNAQLEQA